MQTQLEFFPVEHKTRFLLCYHQIKSQVLAKTWISSLKFFVLILLSVRHSPELDIPHESSSNQQPPNQNCLLSEVHGDMQQGINWKVTALLCILSSVYERGRNTVQANAIGEPAASNPDHSSHPWRRLPRFALPLMNSCAAVRQSNSKHPMRPRHLIITYCFINSLHQLDT